MYLSTRAVIKYNFFVFFWRKESTQAKVPRAPESRSTALPSLCSWTCALALAPLTYASCSVSLRTVFFCFLTSTPSSEVLRNQSVTWFF